MTIPYWDFTIDSTNDVDIYDTLMFSDLFFGKLAMPANVSLGK